MVHHHGAAFQSEAGAPPPAPVDEEVGGGGGAAGGGNYKRLPLVGAAGARRIVGPRGLQVPPADSMQPVPPMHCMLN